MCQSIGIFRKIPLKNTVTRLDGTESKNKARVSNIGVNEKYTINSEYGYKIIKIGNANKTLIGRQTYIIKYTYDIGKDPLKDADELYFNLIGPEWDTSINNVTFQITMPKEFDETLLGFSSGPVGSDNSSNVFYRVDGNVITGILKGAINTGEALTVRLTLPEGYFHGSSIRVDRYCAEVIIFSIVCILVLGGLWIKYGQDNPVIETVEFYPPEDYNSAEVGFLYKGYADNKDVISLLIYLANKGYLKIDEISKDYTKNPIKLKNETIQKANSKIQELENKIKLEKLKDANSPKIKIWENSLRIYRDIDEPVDYQLSKTEEYFLKATAKYYDERFRIIKLKDYDGNNKCEKIFFDGLFTPYSNEKSVTLSELSGKFYTTLDRIKIHLTKEYEDKVFETTISRKRKWFIMIVIAIFALITAKPVIECFGTQAIIGLAIYWGMCTIPAMVKALLSKKTIVNKIIETLILGALCGIPWIVYVWPAVISDTMYTITYIIGIICIIAILVFMRIIPKRTILGHAMLGRLRGFKRFLETAEKEQLEKLVEQNPEYFFDILPYAYVLGVSNVWIEQFETITLQPPSWYNELGDFDIDSFHSFITSTMSSAQSAMSSKPSTGGGGSSLDGGSSSSSGGGSSGGGSGGGGGGSW